MVRKSKKITRRGGVSVHPHSPAAAANGLPPGNPQLSRQLGMMRAPEPVTIINAPVHPTHPRHHRYHRTIRTPRRPLSTHSNTTRTKKHRPQ
jgi:hypothetical protein